MAKEVKGSTLIDPALQLPCEAWRIEQLTTVIPVIPRPTQPFIPRGSVLRLGRQTRVMLMRVVRVFRPNPTHHLTDPTHDKQQQAHGSARKSIIHLYTTLHIKHQLIN